MLKYLILFLIASVFSFLLTPLLRSFAIKVGAIDIPSERKIHDQPIPRLGGLAIFIKVAPENPVLWTGMKGASAESRKKQTRC